MKRILPLVLQAAVVLLAIGAVAFLLWAPAVDGANANSTVFQIYFTDPFVAYVYLASIAYFVGLHRAFTLLGDFRKRGTCSPVTVDALRSIRRCAFWILAAVPGGMAFILSGTPEPPGIVMGLFVAVVASLVAVGATVAARAVQRHLAAADSSRE